MGKKKYQLNISSGGVMLARHKMKPSPNICRFPYECCWAMVVVGLRLIYFGSIHFDFLCWSSRGPTFAFAKAKAGLTHPFPNREGMLHTSPCGSPHAGWLCMMPVAHSSHLQLDKPNPGSLQQRCNVAPP